MIRTVIVDDEVLATVGLKAMIDWPSHGFEIVGEGDNGESGLEAIRRLRPDLVITDIKMPKLDGLEMMRHVLAEQPHIRFVVLSGYNDFPLVKKALQQGAKDYILKLTLRQETLLETLELLRRDILSEQAIAVGKAGVKNESEESPMISDQEARREIRRAFEGNSDSGRIEAVLHSLGLGRPGETDLWIALIEVLPDGKSGNVDSVLVDMIGKLSADFEPSYCFHWEGNRFILLVSAGMTAVLSETEKEMATIGKSLIRMLKQYVNMEAAVGFSAACSRADRLPVALEQAVHATSRSFYDGFGQVFMYDSVNDGQEIDSCVRLNNDEMIERAIDTCAISLIKQVFESVLTGIRTHRPSRSEALEEVYDLLIRMDARTGNDWQEKPEQHAVELHAKIFSLYTFESLTRFFDGYYEVLQDRLNQIRHKNNQVIVIKARNYVAENIRRRITLRETAHRLHVSAGYLSTLFPRVTHMKFTDYVNQAKIKEAQDMIHSGRYRVFEISDALNFQTPSYFTKIFKKYTGCSPSEYAKRVELETMENADD